MGEDYLAMTTKKDKTLFSTTLLTEYDVTSASEIIEIIDDLMFANYPKIKFEHIILWWLSCEPATA